VSGALGGAGRASSAALETIFLNPATLSQAPRIIFGGFLIEGNPRKDTFVRNMSGVVVDNDEEVFFPAGFAYSKNRKLIGTVETREIQYRVAMAKKLNTLTIGVTARLWRVEIVDVSKEEYTTYSLGLIFQPVNFLSLALVLDNLKPVEDPGTVPIYSIGSAFGFNQLIQLKGDVQNPREQNPKKEYIFGFGIETTPFPFITFRFGRLMNKVSSENFWTAGLGFLGPKLQANYSFQANDKVGVLHTIDLSIQF